MVTDIQDPTPGTREHFLHVATLRRWGTIQEYVELCRAHGYFTPAFYAKAAAHMERIHVRRRGVSADRRLSLRPGAASPVQSADLSRPCQGALRPAAAALRRGRRRRG